MCRLPATSATYRRAKLQFSRSRKYNAVPNSSQSAALTVPDSSAAKTQPLDAAQNPTATASQDLSAIASTKENAPAAPPTIEISAAATPPKTTSAGSSPTPHSTAKPEEPASDASSAAALEPAAANSSGAANSLPDMKGLVAVPNPEMRTEFHVKFVEQDSAYLDGGRSSGLKEGLTLVVRDPRPIAGATTIAGSEPIAQLVVVAVAETSAVTEIRTPKRDVVPGDTAYL